MTTEANCVMDGGSIRVLDSEKIRKWKKQHTQGQQFLMVLDDFESSARTSLARRYRATITEYALLMGLEHDYAHAEIKHAAGLFWPEDDPPQARLVRHVRIYGEWEWQLSTIDMDKDELTALLQFAQLALEDNR